VDEMRGPILAAFIVIAFASASARAQENGDARRGLRLAQDACATCHAIRAGQRSPDIRAPAFAAIAAVSGMTAMALQAALLTPHRDMPNLILPPDERADIVAYILSLKTK